MGILVNSDFYRSSDGQTDISYNIWNRDKDEEPKAIFQLVHGMAEHIDRYDEFARFLAKNGYAVFGNDHIGHGNSVADKKHLGHIAGKDGYEHMVNDIHLLTLIAKDRYPGIPVMLFGHSMGSLLVRLYAARWGGEIDGLVVCGTSGSNPLSSTGLALINAIAAIKGWEHRSRIIDNMAFGGYNDKISSPETKFDWLSVNRENIDGYIADERCGVMFTLSGFYNLMTLLKRVTQKNRAVTVPKRLPVLIISGADDPVGGYKKGVTETANMLRSSGIKKINLVFYEGMRHEILNEDDRDRVFEDILRWSDKVLS